MRPAVVVLAAPSGSGKTTIARALVQRWPERYGFSVSATTRPPRASEREGEDYFFLSRTEFVRRRDAGEFLESAEYAGELYGTLTREVDRVLAAGRHVLLDIEVHGARQVRGRYPRPASRTVFILPPSAAELVRRLTGRRTESRGELVQRLETAISELEQAGTFDHVVVNAEVGAAVEAVDGIVQGPQAAPPAAAAAAGVQALIVDLKAKIKEIS